MSGPDSKTPGRRLGRILLFCSIAAFMSFGPCYRQAFNGQGELPFGLEVDRRLFRQWVMFSGYGTDICDVRYYPLDAEGNEEPVDRFEVLGHESFARAPRSIRRLKKPSNVIEMGKRLCRVIRRERGPVDLRVVSRCGSRRGWIPKHDGGENLCHLSQIRPRREGQP